LAKKKDIKDLLDRFVKNDIDPEELDFLYHSLNHDLHNPEVNAWFYRIWDESPKSNKKLRSDQMFESITNKINSPTLFSSLDSYKRPPVLQIALKYAAVFIVGFLIAVLVQQIFQKPKQTLTGLTDNVVQIPLGSKSKILLSDGTQVWLNSGSIIKYPGIFSKTQREVFLEGEAFFDVAHDENCPFIVNTSEINIKVVGTTFNIKSYPEENIVEATLVSGSIEIETRKAGSKIKSQLRLSPNQKATFTKSTSRILLQDITQLADLKPAAVKKIDIQQEVNTDIITSWKDDKLVFSRERFEDIAVKLERWFDVQIILEDEDVKNYRFTGTFDKETLEQALDALKIASSFEFSIDKNTILIYSDKKENKE
jgi:transmembrane sensor